MIAEIHDAEVLAAVNQIVNSGSSSGEKYEQLDKLWFDVVNRHPLGFAAGVLDVVAGAQTQVLYSKGGDA